MDLLALAIAPGIAICIFIYVKDRYNREPLGLLVASFLLGMLSTLPAIIIQLLSGISVPGFAGKSMAQVALYAFGVVALSEEGSKYLMVRYYAYKKAAFDDPFDGIVYSVMVSMGFATLENIGYVLQNGMATGIMRMFLSVPAHATFAVLMGYHIGLAKFDTKNKAVHLFLAILLPVIFHGLFDFFLFMGSTVLNIGGAITSFIVAIWLSKKAIKKHQQNSMNHVNDLLDLPGKGKIE